MGCLQNSVDTLARAGARIEENRPDIDFARSHDIYHQLLTSTTSAGLPQELFDSMLEGAQNLSAEDRGELAVNMRGTAILHRNWLFLNYARTMMRETWAGFFKEFDILLCPAVSVTAFPHDHSEDFLARTLAVNGEDRPYFATAVAWAGLIGMAYLPSTIAPVGPARDGLPVGLQIVAPYLEDRTAIHFAGLVEKTVGGFSPPPDLE